jgi:uncharacterized protein (DUF736 family)
MATIGTFVKSEDGYTGSVKTLSLNIKAKFVPSEKTTDKAPDFRIFSGATEVGAAWRRENDTLSAKFDDPSFPAPIYAALVKSEADDGYSLIWSRRSAD